MSCWWLLPRAGWWCAVWGWETVCWQGTTILTFPLYSKYFVTKAIFFSREAIELLNKLANINGISALCQVRQALSNIIHKHYLTLPNRQWSRGWRLKIRLWTRSKGWKSRGWRRWETGALLPHEPTIIPCLDSTFSGSSPQLWRLLIKP